MRTFFILSYYTSDGVALYVTVSPREGNSTSSSGNNTSRNDDILVILNSTSFSNLLIVKNITYPDMRNLALNHSVSINVSLIDSDPATSIKKIRAIEVVGDEDLWFGEFFFISFLLLIPSIIFYYYI